MPYKGFSKGLICRGKQYAENTVFEEDTAKICKSGMHYCENPFDVLDYYGFVANNGELNEFAEVEPMDEIHTDDGKKFCTKKLKIGKKLDIAGLAKAFVEYTRSKIDCDKAATNTGSWSAATVEGEESFAIATGICSKARGAIGCYIAVAEWVEDESGEFHLADFQTRKVDGKIIKANVFYTLKNGEFVEAAESDDNDQ